MKVTLTKVYELELDFEAEFQRIDNCFKGKLKKDLLAMIAAFKNKEFDKMGKIYESLPKCKTLECPGQECVGLWYYQLCEARSIPTIKIEF